MEFENISNDVSFNSNDVRNLMTLFITFAECSSNNKILNIKLLNMTNLEVGIFACIISIVGLVIGFAYPLKKSKHAENDMNIQDNNL